MHDHWGDLTDPLNPAGLGSGAWLCPDCGEDGELEQLAGGRCPECGGRVELT